MKLRDGPKVENCSQCQKYEMFERLYNELYWELFYEGLANHRSRHREHNKLLSTIAWFETFAEKFADDNPEYIPPHKCELCKKANRWEFEINGHSDSYLDNMKKYEDHYNRHKKYEELGFEYKWERKQRIEARLFLEDYQNKVNQILSNREEAQ